eukprot:scaffold4048_cov73-Isochrysis_galbana.AAC.2
MHPGVGLVTVLARRNQEPGTRNSEPRTRNWELGNPRSKRGRRGAGGRFCFFGEGRVYTRTGTSGVYNEGGGAWRMSVLFFRLEGYVEVYSVGRAAGVFCFLTWNGTSGVSARSFSSLVHGDSCRKRIATSKVAPPHISREKALDRAALV